jgi:hypothetical protein
VNADAAKTAVRNAVQQLNKSERGQQVLIGIATLMDRGAAGLDSTNHNALMNIVEFGFGYFPGALNDALEEVGAEALT